MLSKDVNSLHPDETHAKHWESLYWNVQLEPEPVQVDAVNIPQNKGIGFRTIQVDALLPRFGFAR